jgi:hypothetical protein
MGQEEPAGSPPESESSQSEYQDAEEDPLPLEKIADLESLVISAGNFRPSSRWPWRRDGRDPVTMAEEREELCFTKPMVGVSSKASRRSSDFT